MLLINLDYQTRVPIYEQIVHEIERYVALGILKPKDQIPSIRELAGQLGVNPNTVKKAYDLLESKQVITTISTKGTFIREAISNVIEEKKNSLLEEIIERVQELEKLGMTEEEIIRRIKNREIIFHDFCFIFFNHFS